MIHPGYILGVYFLPFSMFFRKNSSHFFATVALCGLCFSTVHAAAFTHSPSTLSDKSPGGNLTTTDFNTIRTTLDNVFYDSNNSLLGIGVTIPMVELDINGDVRIRAFTTAGFVKNEADGDLVGGQSITGSDIGGFTDGSILFADGDGKLTEDNSSLNWDGTNINIAGNIVPDGTNYTLGTPTKEWEEVYVSSNSLNIGGVKLSKETDNKLYWNNLPLSPMSLASVNTSNGTVNNATALYVDLAGRIGIGTTAPSAFWYLPSGTTTVPSMIIRSGDLTTSPVAKSD